MLAYFVIIFTKQKKPSVINMYRLVGKKTHARGTQRFF